MSQECYTRSKESLNQGTSDLFDLYELSLAVGQSLDLKTNCDHFLKTLMARKNLAYASVWIKGDYLVDKEEGDQPLEILRNLICLVYANPTFRIRETSLSRHHPVLSVLDGREVFSISSSEKNFSQMITEKGVNRGTFIIFSLGNIGFLKLFSTAEKIPFKERRFNELKNVISKFAISLEGCVIHQRVTWEISERLRVEGALQESERRYRELTDSLPEMVYEADKTGKISFINRRAFETFGYNQEDFDHGLTIFQMVIPEDRGRVKQNLEKLLKGEKLINNEYTALRKDGSCFPILSSANLILRDNQSVGGRGVVIDITERKQAEEEIKQTLSLLNATLESTADGILVVDGNGKIESFNLRFVQMWRIPESIIASKDDGQALAFVLDQLKDPEGFLGKVKELYSQPTAESFDLLEFKDGRFFERYSLPQWIGDQCVGRVWSFRDVTEQKKAEESLRTEKQRFQSLSENAPFGMVMIDQDGTFKYINPKFKELFGYDLTDIPNGKTWFRKVYPNSAYRHHVIAQWLKDLESFERGEKIPRILIATCKDGREKIVNFITVLLKTGEYLMACEDITEHRQAEEALRQSEERYRTILEDIEDGYYEVDLTGNLTFFNDSLCRILGYSKDEMMGMGNQQYTDPENRKKLFEAFNRVYRTGKSTQGFDWEVFRKDGTKIFGEVSVSLIKDSKGQPTGFRGIARDITDRKQAEEALRTEKRRFQTLSEQAPFGMVMIEHDGTFRYINPKFKELFGYDLSDIPNGKTWFRKAYPNPTYRHRVIETWFKDLESFKPGEKRSEVFTVTCKDGTEKAINFIPVKLETGENLMTCEDITERKRTEEAIRTSEERFRIAAESSSDLIWDWDILGGSLQWFGNVDERLGYNPGEFPRKIEAWERIIHLDERDHVLIALEEHLKTGKPYMEEYRVQRKDGTFCYWIDCGAAFWDEKGNPVKMIGACTDITERKRAEKALKKSEARFQELFNDAPVGYFEYDVEGRIVDVNRTELEMLGYAREEMLGHPVWEFVVEKELARHQILEKLAGKMPTARGIERIYRRKDGTKFTGIIEDRLLKDSDGKIIGIRSTIQDITDRKRAEEEMMVLEEQLRQSQKMEAIGQLAGGIAHDFNNLLTIIKGYSQLSFLDLKESDSLWGNIQEIQKAAQRASDLTRQLLAFSRRQILDLKVLDLNTRLRDLNKMLHRIIGEDIELVTLLAKDLGRIKIDPGQIEQVIFNLAVNARDAMPSGGNLIIETANVELDEEYARAHISVKTGPYVLLSFSDTGVGIPYDIKEKVFDPFFTTKNLGRGTGLGLSTVYGIVKQSGGNIWVYSELGKGTTFKIYLPKVEEELDNLHAQDETEFLPRGSETVLLVEDEKEVRSLAHRILSQQGYKILEAANGEEALQVAQEHAGEKIHLLLTDVVMPHMGGRDLAEKLKLFRPDIKVFYVSGYTDNAIVHHGVLNPGTHFLQKPFSPKTLSQKVREVLDR